MTDHKDLIERAKAALEGATPGPWLVPDQTRRRSLTVEVTGNALVQCPGSGGSVRPAPHGPLGHHPLLRGPDALRML